MQPGDGFTQGPYGPPRGPSPQGPYVPPQGPYGPPQGPYGPPQGPPPPGKGVSGVKVALILGGTMLGIVALLVTVVFVVREQVAGTGHELAWQVKGEPESRDDDLAAYVVGDRFFRISSLGITGYALADGEQKSTKHFAQDEACYAAQQPVGRLAVLVKSTGDDACASLAAVDVTTGQERWRLPLRRSEATDELSAYTRKGITIAGGTALFSTGYDIQAVDARAGKQLWSVPLKSNCRLEDVTADRERVVAATFCGDAPRDHRLAELDPATGKERWSVTYAKQTTDEYRASVVGTDPPAVLTVDEDKTKGKSALQLFDANGKKKRTVGARVDDSAEELERGHVSEFRVVGDRLVCLTQSSRFVAFDLATGDREWTAKPSALPTLVTGADDGRLPLVSGYTRVRYSTVDPESGDIDRGKLLPEGADDDAEFWLSGDTLVALNDYPDDGPWLAAYRMQ